MVTDYVNLEDEYIKALNLGKRAYRRAVNAGLHPCLSALDEILSRDETRGEENIGTLEIPTSGIVGTVTGSRQESFAENFMPLLDIKSEFADKWMNLLNAQLSDGIRDPVLVYEYMQRFYVQEGNKRVSVLKYLGIPQLPAQVVRVLPLINDDEETKVYLEFTDFFKDAPFYGLTFSRTGSYAKMTELFNEKSGRKWSDDALMNLKSAQFAFSEQYLSIVPKTMNITCGDAFLIYISVYGAFSLLHDDAYDITRKIRKIRNEFLLANEGSSIYFSSGPVDSGRAPFLQDLRSRFSPYSEKSPLRAAFLYDTSPESSPLAYAHELGRNYLTERLGALVETSVYNDCIDGKHFDAAVRDACGHGAELIVSASPAQMQDALRMAIAYPKVRFINCSVNLPHKAVRSYYGRMYEAKFIMGAIAASLCENDPLYYVCDYPVYGAFSEINAFALGASCVRPASRVKLLWSGLKNSNFLNEINSNPAAIVSGTDFAPPGASNREYGLYMKNPHGRVTYLAMPVTDWGRFYEKIFLSVFNGRFDAEGGKDNRAFSYYWGMAAGMVDIILSKHLPESSIRLANGLKRAVASGAFTPFDGNIFARGHEQVKSEKEIFSSRDIVSMTWLAENVDGEIPARDAFDEHGGKLLAISGIYA